MFGNIRDGNKCWRCHSTETDTFGEVSVRWKLGLIHSGKCGRILCKESFSSSQNRSIPPHSFSVLKMKDNEELSPFHGIDLGLFSSMWSPLDIFSPGIFFKYLFHCLWSICSLENRLETYYKLIDIFFGALNSIHFTQLFVSTFQYFPNENWR